MSGNISSVMNSLHRLCLRQLVVWIWQTVRPCHVCKQEVYLPFWVFQIVICYVKVIDWSSFILPVEWFLWNLYLVFVKKSVVRFVVFEFFTLISFLFIYIVVGDTRYFWPLRELLDLIIYLLVEFTLKSSYRLIAVSNCFFLNCRFVCLWLDNFTLSC